MNGTAPDPVSPPAELVEAISARGAALRARLAELTDRPVRIVCVTKGHGVEVAAAAWKAGFEDLGESYAQELLPKARQLGEGPRWHFVGRLQSNKVRQLREVVSVWQSVDRTSLASEIARRAPGATVMVQLDLAGLPDRGGCDPAAAPGLVEHCRSLGLDVVGLMGVGVPGPPELSRAPFARLVAMAEDLGLPERSIGMSGDLEVAVQEGATTVRIGTGLVGPRPVRQG